MLSVLNIHTGQVVTGPSQCFTVPGPRDALNSSVLLHPTEIVNALRHSMNTKMHIKNQLHEALAGCIAGDTTAKANALNDFIHRQHIVFESITAMQHTLRNYAENCARQFTYLNEVRAELFAGANSASFEELFRAIRQADITAHTKFALVSMITGKYQGHLDCPTVEEATENLTSYLPPKASISSQKSKPADSQRTQSINGDDVANNNNGELQALSRLAAAAQKANGAVMPTLAPGDTAESSQTVYTAPSTTAATHNADNATAYRNADAAAPTVNAGPFLSRVRAAKRSRAGDYVITPAANRATASQPTAPTPTLDVATDHDDAPITKKGAEDNVLVETSESLLTPQKKIHSM